MKEHLISLLQETFAFRVYRVGLLEEIKKNPNVWYCVSFSPLAISSPNTLFFTLLRYLNPCKKYVDSIPVRFAKYKNSVKKQ